MFTYRILNLETNQIIPNDEVSLAPDGTLTVKGDVFTGKFEVQPSIQLRNQPAIFVGDAVSYTYEHTKDHTNHVHYLLSRQMYYVPDVDTYDELLIQFVQEEENHMYFWVTFKSKGEFIKNKDCQMPDEDDPEGIRAIPTSDDGILRGLTNYGSYEVRYNCTDEEWMAF